MTPIAIGAHGYEFARQHQEKILEEARQDFLRRQELGLCAHCMRPHNGRFQHGAYFCKKHTPTHNSKG